MNLSKKSLNLLEDIIVKNGKAATYFTSLKNDVQEFGIAIEQNKAFGSYDVNVYFYFVDKQAIESELHLNLSKGNLTKEGAVLYAQALYIYLHNEVRGVVVNMDNVNVFEKELEKKYGTAEEFLKAFPAPITSINYFRIHEFTDKTDETEIRITFTFEKDIEDTGNLNDILYDTFCRLFIEAEEALAYKYALYYYFSEVLKTKIPA